jgi:hypothetical protein
VLAVVQVGGTAFEGTSCQLIRPDRRLRAVRFGSRPPTHKRGGVSGDAQRFDHRLPNLGRAADWIVWQ